MSSLSGPRRRAPLGLGLLSLVAGAALATAPAQVISSAHADDPTTSPLRIGSYNIEFGEPMSEFRPAADFILSRADVVGFQEVGGQQRKAYLDGNPAWRVYHAPDNRQVPIAWNPRVFEPVSATEFKLADGARVEEVPGGDGKDGTVYRAPTYGAVVRLRQIATGYEFALINVHLIHGAVKGGKPAPGRPLLYDVYKQQVQSLRSEVSNQQSAGFPVYVTGDFNIGYVQDQDTDLNGNPYHNLTASQETATWQDKKLSSYGTHIDTSCRPGVKHCGAYIDQTWGPTESADAKVFIHVVHSDHYPIRSTYQIPVPDGYVPPTGTVGFAVTHLSSPEWNKPYQSRKNPMVFPLTGDLDHGFVNVAVTGGSGVEGKDFTVDASSLYDADPSNDQVVVETIPDFKPESDKTFTLTLVDPFDTTITQGTATGTIVDDD
jgi:hypothetical protein